MASARFKSGGVLLSHILSGAVPSALSGLTSGFGMGPGVSRLAMAAVTACQPFIHLCPRCLGLGLLVGNWVVDACSALLVSFQTLD